MIWWQGDPYTVDSEGEYVELHHGGYAEDPPNIERGEN